MKEYVWIGAAIKDYDCLVENFKYYQRWQELLREDYHNWPGPPESYYKDVYQSHIAEQILFNKRELRHLEGKIKELKKIIKKLNRKQNLENNCKQ